MHRLLFVLAALVSPLVAAQPVTAPPFTVTSPQVKSARAAYAECFISAGELPSTNRIDRSDVLERTSAQMCEGKLEVLRKALYAENRAHRDAAAFAEGHAEMVKQENVELATSAFVLARTATPR